MKTKRMQKTVKAAVIVIATTTRKMETNLIAPIVIVMTTRKMETNLIAQIVMMMTRQLPPHLLLNKGQQTLSSNKIKLSFIV